MKTTEEERNQRLNLIVKVIAKCGDLGAIEDELIKEFCRIKGCGYSKAQEYVDELRKTGRIIKKQGADFKNRLRLSKETLKNFEWNWDIGGYSLR